MTWNAIHMSKVVILTQYIKENGRIQYTIGNFHSTSTAIGSACSCVLSNNFFNMTLQTVSSTLTNFINIRTFS